jgi:hypothetical protein
MSNNVDPLDTPRVVDELERKVVPAVAQVPVPPPSEGAVGAVPDQADDVPGAPEPPD